MKIGVIKKYFGLKAAIALVIILAAAGGGYWYMTHRTQEIQYQTKKAVKSDLRSVISATGKLNPVETVDVGTQISGTINEVYIDYNSVVKKGDLIAEMDPSTQIANVQSARAALNSAQANLANAEAVLSNAQKNLARTRILAAKDLVARSDLDNDEKALLVAKAESAAAAANVDQSRADLYKAEITLGYTKIYSPINGVIVSKNVEKGQTVAASYQTPSIAEIAKDLTQMQVEIDVDEADIGGVKEGQSAIFTVDTYPDKSFEGKVSQIRLAPATTSDNVVTYTVIAKVSNKNGVLLPGMTANVSLIVKERENVIVVPNSAFRFKPIDLKANTAMQGSPGGGKLNIAEVAAPAVYKLDKKTPVKVEVKKGITDGQNTEIISGISEGEDIITGIVIEKEDK